MCGIAGIVAADRLETEDRQRVSAMRDILAHRGPDEAGAHADDHAALGHRRLSIVDLSNGQQPLSNEDRDHLDHLQRRDLQPRGPAPGARGGRPRLSHSLRHRDHRSRLRAVGRRLRASPPRDVRVRDLGRAEAAASARARSARCQASLLDGRRRAAPLRFGDQGDPRERARRGSRQRGGAPGAPDDALLVVG